MSNLIKRKVAVVTGTRAEYGLMRWVIQGIQEHPLLELQIVVTGMHLSPEFGLTYKSILEDGFEVNKKIEVILSSDSPVGISKSMGLGMISFAEAYSELRPDIILVLGDRFEIFSAVAAAMVSRIPIAHIHGGEATEGLIDEPIRHSITKMSHVHFAATEEYRRRIIQLGEDPNRVFNTGTPGIDNIYRLKLLSKKEFEESIGFEIGEKSILITFHPVTLENQTAGYQFDELLKALIQFDEYKLIFTMPNADTDGRVIIDKINKFVAKYPMRSVAFTSLGQLRYLSALRFISVVIGNSSSGLTEAPSFKVPTVNIGDRQNGRIKAESVIDCNPNSDDIVKSLEIATSSDFRARITNMKNPYGEGGASQKIVENLATINLDGILKKKFFNL